jgi:hypothetical protein
MARVYTSIREVLLQVLQDRQDKPYRGGCLSISQALAPQPVPLLESAVSH